MRGDSGRDAVPAWPSNAAVSVCRTDSALSLIRSTVTIEFWKSAGARACHVAHGAPRVSHGAVRSGTMDV